MLHPIVLEIYIRSLSDRPHLYDYGVDIKSVFEILVEMETEAPIIMEILKNWNK